MKRKMSRARLFYIGVVLSLVFIVGSASIRALNAMAKPVPAAGPKAPSSQAPAGTGKKATGKAAWTPGGQLWLRLWKDPAESAFSLLIPKGWSASGGVVRVNTDPCFQFEALNGESKVWIEWPVPEEYFEPTNYVASMGYSEGRRVTDYGMNFLILRYHDSREFINGLWLPMARKQFPDIVVTSLQDAPELARTYGEPNATESTAATATASFTSKGKAMKAGVTAVTDRIITGPENGIWICRDLGVLASREKFSQVSRLFSLMLSTLRVNPEWIKAEMAGRIERRGRIHETTERLIAMDYRMFKEEQESRARIGQGWMDALGGTQTLRNPSTGETYRVPYAPGLNYFWGDTGGNVVGTEVNASPGMGFSRLQR